MLLQPYAAQSLLRVVERRPGKILSVASCLRVLPGQYLLYHWYKSGRCSIKLAAPPGASNHERGNAVDVGGYADWKPAFLAEGWRWLGSRGDEPHFDRVSGRDDVDNRLVAAFQRLANKNMGAGLAEDGMFGPATEAALRSAPAEGWRMAVEAVKRIKTNINGHDQTERVESWLKDGDTTGGAYRDLWDYFGWKTPPRYDPATETVYLITPQGEEQSHAE